ncbi:MAG: hypothetical protein FJX76_01500 [Armatimonadetes bacterium]|nr:hypothetical protein [Armatimonadota bacterium]MBM3738935.1 hypothetical protein [Acidobacteriota bacterium]
MEDFGKEAAKWLWGLLVPAAWWMWNKQDKRLDGKAEARDVADLKDVLDRLRGSVVMQEDLKERRREIDATMEARRQGELALHERLNDHIEADLRMHAEIIKGQGELSSALARIEGRLSK